MTPLYIYTKAARLANAVATNTTDLAALVTANADPLDPDNATTLARIAATVPELALGDQPQFTCYFYDDATTVSSWSGVNTSTVEVGLGLLDLNGQQVLASNVLTATTNGFTGRLDLTTATLQSRVQAEVSGGFGRGKWFESNVAGKMLPIHIRRVITSGNYFETYALWQIFVRDRVLVT